MMLLFGIMILTTLGHHINPAWFVLGFIELIIYISGKIEIEEIKK